MNIFTLLILFFLGILLTYFGFLNVSLTAAPENVDDILQKYNNTYAIKVLPSTDNPDQKKIIQQNMNNANRLMILAIISGLYLITFSLFEGGMMYFSKSNTKKQHRQQHGQQHRQQHEQEHRQQHGQQQR